MAKQLFARIPMMRALALASLLFLGVTVSSAVQPPQRAQCTGCQACYCDDIKYEFINGVLTRVCYVNGRPSSCIGCIGNCTSVNNCQCKPNEGGCGTKIAWCRSEDCSATPPPTQAAPTPTPPPPPECAAPVEWVYVEPPAASIEYEPPFPIVVGQDPEFRGFDLIIEATGGWAEKRRKEAKQLCADGSGEYPDDCPDQAWEWECVETVLEYYDDPIVNADLGMRLGDGVREWIERDLGARYYGATVQDDLPKVFNLYEGETMEWSYIFEYKARDPGIHGGRLILTTKGTPLSEPQQVSFPYEVPVYLLDTTLDGSP